MIKTIICRQSHRNCMTLRKSRLKLRGEDGGKLLHDLVESNGVGPADRPRPPQVVVSVHGSGWGGEKDPDDRWGVVGLRKDPRIFGTGADRARLLPGIRWLSEKNGCVTRKIHGFGFVIFGEDGGNRYYGPHHHFILIRKAMVQYWYDDSMVKWWSKLLFSIFFSTIN